MDRLEDIHRKLSASASTDRTAGSEGERQMLDAVRSVLGPDIHTRSEGLVAHTRPHLVMGFVAAALLVGGLLGVWFPKVGLFLLIGGAIGLVGEGTGRFPVVRWWMPRWPAYNLVVPPQGEWNRGGDAPLGTVILSTPLDVPRYRPPGGRWLKRPYRLITVAGTLLGAMLFLRVLSAQLDEVLVPIYWVVLALSAVIMGIGLVVRSPDVEELQDVSGLASTADLLLRLRRSPVEGLQVWGLFTAAGCAHQDGMRAFLALRAHNLPGPLFVLSLNHVGRPVLKAAVSEGPLVPQHHRPTGPSLVERLSWAGLHLPRTDQGTPTDARAALNLGHRALSLVGGQEPSSISGMRYAVHVADLMLRWFGEDLRRVATERPVVESIEQPTVEEPEAAPEAREPQDRPARRPLDPFPPAPDRRGPPPVPQEDQSPSVDRPSEDDED